MEQGLPPGRPPFDLNAFRLKAVGHYFTTAEPRSSQAKNTRPGGFFGLWRIKLSGTSKRKKLEGGEWSSKLFNCRSLSCCREDWGVCCIACWCSCILIPQLYEREVGPPGACRKWFFRLGCVCSLNFFVVGTRNIWVTATFRWWEGRWEAYDYMPDITVGAAACVLTMIAMTIAILLLRVVRRRIRERDGIPAGRCGERSEDCAAACCCTMCVGCQILRHLGLRWGPICCWADEEAVRRRRYTLKSTTGERAAVVADAATVAVAAARLAERLARPPSQTRRPPPPLADDAAATVAAVV